MTNPSNARPTAARAQPSRLLHLLTAAELVASSHPVDVDELQAVVLQLTQLQAKLAVCRALQLAGKL